MAVTPLDRSRARFRTGLAVTLASLGLLLITAEPLSGQRWSQRAQGYAGAGPALDYFVSRYQPVGEPDAGTADGVGGRLMWALPSLLGTEAPVISRTDVGAFLVHAPDREGRQQMWWYGAQADVHLSRSPAVHRLDPFVSVGVGATRSDVLIGVGSTADPPAAPHGKPVSHTRLSVAPGLGMRLYLRPGLGLRGDARQIIDFHEVSRRNLELSAGLSIGT